jgi:hypothetical protein
MTRDFWLDAAERAIKTFAQTMIAFLGADAFNVIDADWTEALSIALGAVVLSVLTSLLSIKLGGNGTASATNAVVTSSYADAVAHGRRASGLTEGPP